MWIVILESGTVDFAPMPEYDRTDRRGEEKGRKGKDRMRIGKIRPAEEEIGNLLPLILFSILWYSTLGVSIVENGFQPGLILFLAAGLLPLYQAFMSIRRALFYRRQRAEAVALGRPARGRIVGISREDVPYYTSGKHRRLRYRRYYYLEVEVADPDTGIVSRIRSQGYRRPIHRYLGSDQVSVYTDKSGWKHYLENFQWKERRGDPDIFGGSCDFEEAHPGAERIGQFLFTAVLVLMLLHMFFRF